MDPACTPCAEALDARVVSGLLFPDGPAPHQQESGIQPLVAAWQQFVRRLQEDDSCVDTTDRSRAFPPLWQDLSSGSLAALHAAATLLGNTSVVTWFARFGCALLALPGQELELDSRHVPGHVQLMLIGLDNWALQLHSSSAGFEMEHTASCDGHAVQWCGSIPAHQLGSFVSLAYELISVHKQARTKASAKGYSCTPSMVHAVVCDAIRLMRSQPVSLLLQKLPSHSELTVPRGGYTDVGQHTGTQPRNTAWPLVSQVLRMLLLHAVPCRPDHNCHSCDAQEPPEALFSSAVAHFQLWLTVGHVWRLQPSSCTPSALNTGMTLLASAATHAARLAAGGFDVRPFEDWCERARLQMQKLAAERAAGAAQAYALPDLAEDLAKSLNPGSRTLPVGSLPARMAASSQAQGLQAARRRADTNLGALPVLAADAQPSDLLQLLPSLSSCSDAALAAQVALRGIESNLFKRVTSRPLGQMPLLQLPELEALTSLVDQYRVVLKGYLDQHGLQACMHAEQRSRELLVAWAMYCLLDAACRQQHPSLCPYGVSLRWQDLRHLLLSDKEAVSAALAVAAYLQARFRPGLEAFSLRDGGAATLSLAQQFAEQDSTLLWIWQRQQVDAQARVEAHWAEVQRKQRLVASLEAELQQLRARWFSEEIECSSAHSALYGASWAHRTPDSSAYRSAKSRLSACQSRVSETKAAISSCEGKLRDAKVAPDPVIQPLPEGQDKALQWLFFLYMPPLFRQLSRASFLAQQLLLPSLQQHPDVAAAIAWPTHGSFKTEIVSHYNTKQASVYHSAAQSPVTCPMGHVRLQSSNSVPVDVGPDAVMSITCKRDGVWWPDDLDLSMAWAGSGCSVEQDLSYPPCFNPFAAYDAKFTALAFTEQLDSYDGSNSEALQEAVPLLGGARNIHADRGNLGIAWQFLRPLDRFSKPGWLDFWRLRAYPLRQMEVLATSLHAGDLPLADSAVVTVVKSALYHLGELQGTTPPSLAWRADWSNPSGVLAALHHELEVLADRLRDARREHASALVLGEAAAYLCGWHGPLAGTARRFAAMLSEAADDMEGQIVKAMGEGEEEVEEHLEAEQCRGRMRALLCYGGSLQLSSVDAAAVVRLMVLVNHGDVFIQSASLRQQLRDLRVRCQNLMAARCEDLVRFATADGSLLTEAVRQVLQRTPSFLTWTAAEDGDLTSSFHAAGLDGHLYSINLLDGTVLLDGSPPSRLPKDIVSHALYKRVFGRANFKVSITDSGALETIRPVNGRHYNFCLSAAGAALRVSELVDVGGGTARETETLELLDVGSDESCGAWGRELPVRLRELHSHWLDRKRGVILLRPTSIEQHDVHFLVQLAARSSAQEVASQHLMCWRVPLHLRGRLWTELLRAECAAQITDMLLLDTSCTQHKVLAKFEAPCFIHTYLRGPSLHDSQARGNAAARRSTRRNGACSDVAAASSSGDGAPVETLVFELPRFQLEFELRGGATPQACGGGELPHGAAYALASNNYSGYELAPDQQLLGRRESAPGGAVWTLPEFSQYLVLQQREGTRLEVGLDKAMQLVLVPAGRVGADRSETAAAGAVVTLQVPQASGAELKVHCYEVHPRFGHLRASSVLARLQLAALYAATSTLLPEPQSCATGAQTALSLLRQSWVHRPLSAEEEGQLRSVAQLGGHLVPALHVLVADQLLSSAQVHFLHCPNATSPAVPVVDGDAASAYYQQQRSARQLQELSGSMNPRMQLSREEVVRVLGSSQPAPVVPAWMQRGRHQTISIPPCPVRSDLVPETERGLAALVQFTLPPSQVPAYPLEVRVGAQALERDMHRELKLSWQAHHRLAVPLGVKSNALRVIRKFQKEISAARESAETYLLQHIAAVPLTTSSAPGSEPCPHRAAARLLRTAGLAASCSLLDLVRMAVEPRLLLQLNPFLSLKSQQCIASAVLLWLQLSVLEDRLGRLHLLAQGGGDKLPELLQELQVRRTWDVHTHPEWLVFEVEGQLQIRPTQHTVAQALIKQLSTPGQPGPIMQLNMGEGKTRVILPMLALHWGKDLKRLVRLSFLSTLLDEAHDYLHLDLCASVLGRKLFRLPFHRDVPITEAGALTIRAFLNHCVQVGGMLLVAPEHRLSLHLKWHELWARGDDAARATCGALDLVRAAPCVDLLDESDELLHHRFQLVYACGSSMPLPSLQERMDAIKALLHVVSRCTPRDPSHPLHQRLRSGKAADWAAPPRPGAFCGLRLLPGQELEALLPELHRGWAQALLKEPPYCMRWLRTLNASERVLVVRCITDSSAAAEQVLGASLWDRLTQDQRSQLLVLRGLLGCSLLAHSLQKRHGVAYGVNRLPQARKRLAVPYRAADSPAERAEYAQPDVAILLTLLSYAYDGLSTKELQLAVQKLLKMGGNAQKQRYCMWLEQARLDEWPGLTLDDVRALDDVAKLDPSNLQQLQLLHRAFSHNLEAVGFYLEFCVLPDDTKTYPQRLACSSWHLTDNPDGAVAGFSGTNDNHRLLPLQVSQQQAADRALEGTNGKMLQVMLNNPQYSTLPAEEGKPQWQALLDKVERHSGPGAAAAVGSAAQPPLHALIDCGALLEGISTRKAAEHLLPRLDAGLFKGVAFFDTEAMHFVIIERNGRVLPARSSPVAQRDVFAVYDEARCRGADLKLRAEARGLVTLSQGLCKDKLMQAAGRLRKLGRGQSLCFVGPPDVTAKIRLTSGLSASAQVTSRHILQWVMDSTVAATQQGLLEWAAQGIHFAVTKGTPECAQQDEQLGLQESYGGAWALQPVEQVVQEMREVAEAKLSAGGQCLDKDTQDLVERICQHSTKHGHGYHARTGRSMADEECEREVEKEEEEEEEREMELARAEPEMEVDWDYSCALRATSASELREMADAQPLRSVVRWLQPSTLRHFQWPDDVLCTSNFLYATDQSSFGTMNEYLRPVGALLVFSDTSVLLVSEREADVLFELGRHAAASKAGAGVTGVRPPVLTSLCYAQEAWQSGRGVRLAQRLGCRDATTPARPSSSALAAIQLFDGQTSYGGQACEVYRELQRLLSQSAHCASTCLELVASRGKQSLFSHSDLERACDASMTLSLSRATVEVLARKRRRSAEGHEESGRKPDQQATKFKASS